MHPSILLAAFKPPIFLAKMGGDFTPPFLIILSLSTTSDHKPEQQHNNSQALVHSYVLLGELVSEEFCSNTRTSITKLSDSINCIQDN